MKKKITLILFVFISIFIFNIRVNADDFDNLVNIYFFHSDSCSHCKEEVKFIKELENRYDNIKVYKYEIHKKDNYDLLKEVSLMYNININSVPLTIIGDKVYTGYSENSRIKFIKTIEYFSRYGYEDKIGEYLNLELSTYDIQSDGMKIDDFIRVYHNYDLLGFKTSELDWNGISLLLGVSLSMNMVSILSIILVVIMINKLGKDSNGLLFNMIYIVISVILLLSILISNRIISVMVYLLLLILVVISFIKNNRKLDVLLIIVVIISVVSNYLMINIFSDNILIFKNILGLYGLVGLNKVSYYSNLIVMVFVLNILMICLIDIIVKRINNNR